MHSLTQCVFFSFVRIWSLLFNHTIQQCHLISEVLWWDPWALIKTSAIWITSPLVALWMCWFVVTHMARERGMRLLQNVCPFIHSAGAFIHSVLNVIVLSIVEGTVEICVLAVSVCVCVHVCMHLCICICVYGMCVHLCEIDRSVYNEWSILQLKKQSTHG